MQGNTTFAAIPTDTNEDIYIYEGSLESSTFYMNYSVEDKYNNEVWKPILPTESFMMMNIPVPSNIQLKGVKRTGELIYVDKNNTPTDNPSIPTINGSSSLYITTTSTGINVAVSTPQYVRVVAANGTVLFCGMVQDSVDVSLPISAIYIVAGEHEIQKIIRK